MGLSTEVAAAVVVVEVFFAGGGWGWGVQLPVDLQITELAD